MPPLTSAICWSFSRCPLTAGTLIDALNAAGSGSAAAGMTEIIGKVTAEAAATAATRPR